MATSELGALSTLLTLVINISHLRRHPLNSSRPCCRLFSAIALLSLLVVIVVFDAYDQIGQVTPEQASNYVLYKENVKSLILNEFLNTDAAASDWVQSTAEAEYGSPFLIRNAVDLLISRTANHRKRIGFGLADVPVKYICLPAVRMLGYATSAHVDQFPVLKELTVQLKRRFTPASQPDVSIPLTPLFFWHDKPHDKVGQHARAQMKEGQWAKWATWLKAIYRQRNDCSRKPSLVGAAASVGECTDREET
ncbi:hypothetical protein B0H14DRAFT_2965593 [Mycena olivaceomarginata]|nr:hypothetical protein B0H14DRAFT_2965593 [Mycena olivaceomarginata]